MQNNNRSSITLSLQLNDDVVAQWIQDQLFSLLPELSFTDDAEFVLVELESQLTLRHHDVTIMHLDLPLMWRHAAPDIIHALQHAMRPLRLPRGWQLDLSKRIIHHPDHVAPCELTEKETELLKCLHDKAESIHKNTLIESVWNHHPDAQSHTLETHLYRLRQKLDDYGTGALVIAIEDGFITLA